MLQSQRHKHCENSNRPGSGGLRGGRRLRRRGRGRGVEFGALDEFECLRERRGRVEERR